MASGGLDGTVKLWETTSCTLMCRPRDRFASTIAGVSPGFSPVAGLLLREAFNRAFWLGDAEYLAFCRQGDGRFSRSIASNGAHTLWTGIVEPGHARALVRRVLRPDMFSGWGVRTLSADDRSYKPIDHQVGSVWPHDNSFIVAGMQRYGFGEEAATVFTAIVQAASSPSSPSGEQAKPHEKEVLMTATLTSAAPRRLTASGDVWLARQHTQHWRNST